MFIKRSGGALELGDRWILQNHDCIYWAASNSMNTHIRRGFIPCCEPASRQKRTRVCPRTTVHHALQSKALHHFHVQRVQLFQPDNHPRSVTFPQWFINRSAANMLFVSSELLCDEATFYVKWCLIRTTRTC